MKHALLRLVAIGMVALAAGGASAQTYPSLAVKTVAGLIALAKSLVKAEIARWAKVIKAAGIRED